MNKLQKEIDEDIKVLKVIEDTKNKVINAINK